MIKKTIRDLIPMIIIICMFAYVLSHVFNLFEIPFLQQFTTSTGQTLWKYDIKAYIANIDGSFNSLQDLKLEKNPLEWQNTNSNFLQAEFWQTLLNNLAYMFNGFIYIINVVLFVVRFLAYIIINIFSILGMIRQRTYYNNQIFEPNWIMETLSWITNSLQIPFITMGNN